MTISRTQSVRLRYLSPHIQRKSAHFSVTGADVSLEMVLAGQFMLCLSLNRGFKSDL